MSTPRKISVICTWFPGEVGIARKLHRRRAVSGRFVQHLLIFGNDDRPADHDPVDRLRPALHIPAPLHGVVVQRAGQNHGESGRLDPEDPLPLLRNVQVDLDDPPPGKAPLQAPGEQRLLQFPDGVFRRGEVEILYELPAMISENSGKKKIPENLV